MWELTKRISLRNSPVLYKVEPEPDLYTGFGSDQKYRLRPVPAPQHCDNKQVIEVNRNKTFSSKYNRTAKRNGHASIFLH